MNLVKVPIYKILFCNKALFKLYNQRSLLPVSIGLKLHKMIKQFDEIEEYVFNLMEITFENFDISNMTEEQTKFYNKIISSEVEVDISYVNKEFFVFINDLMLTLEDIEYLSILFKE